jgi:hypothetical protein
MKTVYMYTALVPAIAVLVVGVTLLPQTLGTASVEKTAQYQQSAKSVPKKQAQDRK